ncbi:glycosyl hydrolase [Paraburkholderia youngii]|uniref:glycosyl hydrolase n=1 Tax=Paraburkholderia youngii TaxID=2782701 RepID=UPI003D1B0BE5
MGNNTKSASSPLNTTIDVVDVHPYFGSAEYDTLVQAFVTTVSNLVSSGAKPIWLTETNNGTNGTDAGQMAAFNQLKILMNNGSVAKAFWMSCVTAIRAMARVTATRSTTTTVT